MNSFNQYLINKIDVMEGIDFKANRNRQILKDKTKEQNKKNDRIHNIMMTLIITGLIIMGIVLLNATARETDEMRTECMKYHSENYCMKNI